MLFLSFPFYILEIDSRQNLETKMNEKIRVYQDLTMSCRIKTIWVKILVLPLLSVEKLFKLYEFSFNPFKRHKWKSSHQRVLRINWEYILFTYSMIWASLVAQMVKNPLQCGRPGFDPWVGKIPWRSTCQPTPVCLPGEFHGQRNLVGYNPWGTKESDMTEWLSTAQHSTFSANPLATWCKELTHWKRPWCWERLKGTTEDETVGWHHQLDGHEFE